MFVRVSVPAIVAKSASESAVLNSASVPVSVFVARETDLFVRVSVVALPTKVSVAFGRVTVTSCVGSVTSSVSSKSSGVAPSKVILSAKVGVVETVASITPVVSLYENEIPLCAPFVNMAAVVSCRNSVEASVRTVDPFTVADVPSTTRPFLMRKALSTVAIYFSFRSGLQTCTVEPYGHRA